MKPDTQPSSRVDEALVECSQASRTLAHLHALALRLQKRERASLSDIERASLLLLRLRVDEREAGDRLMREINQHGPYPCGLSWMQAMQNPDFRLRQEAFRARYERIRRQEAAKASTHPTARGRKTARTCSSACRSQDGRISA